MPKGQNFERETARKLSLWWTDNTRDDIFWRADTSGARATTRAKKGLKTANSYGDISSIDPIGYDLLKFVTIECKRGYSAKSFADLLDRSRKKNTKQQWEEWIVQAITAQQNAGSMHWMIISRRDQREAIVMCPSKMMEGFVFRHNICSVFLYKVMNLEPLCVMLFDDWLGMVSPNYIRHLISSRKED